MIVLGVICAGLALLFNLRPVLEVANCFTLVWYGITHHCALRVREDQRLLPRFVSWLGLAGCAALLLALPITAVGIAAGVLAALLVARQLLHRAPASGSPPNCR